MEETLFIHYLELPEDIFISLKDDFHKRFCFTIQNKINHKFKNCFHKILKCPEWHAKRLFNKEIRFTIKELEILRKFTEFSKEEVEENIETIGNKEDGTIIKNPKFPFHLKDIFYIASHLIFDGSFRFKKGGYFFAYEPSLVDYHKERLSKFGDVPTNLLEKENQLYFSYTLGYIASKILEIESFKSMKCCLSNKFKSLAKENKILADEIVKALIIDEAYVEDKIEAELCNEQLVKDLYEIISTYYKLTKLSFRKRYIYFKKNPAWNHFSSSWKFGFSAKSFRDLNNSISPLPIDYKEENLKFLVKRQNTNTHRKTNETKKLIVKSLFENPKTIMELAKELCVKQTSIIGHLNGHPTYRDSLINLGIVTRIGEKILRRGGYAKVGIYGIKDVEKAKDFINN